MEAKSLNSPFELSSLARENHRPYLAMQDYTMQGYRRLEPMTFQDKRVQAIEFEAGWRAAVDYATGAQDFAGQARRRTENGGDRRDQLRELADEVIE